MFPVPTSWTSYLAICYALAGNDIVNTVPILQEISWDSVGFRPLFWLTLSRQNGNTESMYSTVNNCNFVVSTVPAAGLALMNRSGDRWIPLTKASNVEF